MISSEALGVFKAIWREEFDEEPSDEIAIEEAINLLTMMDKIYRPIEQKWLNEYEKDEKSKQ